MVDVSVIIPVYNTEQYLDECLKSIVNQTLKDIEIICIDDGSTDKSINILKKYENQDSRFIVMAQENAGQGNARNKGIDLANGKYIYFMDSDDTLELNALEDTFKMAEEKSLDFLLFKVINYDEDMGELFKNEYYSMEELTEFVGDEVFSPDDLGELLLDIPVSPVNKLYNREFIISAGARFPEDIIFEDNLFFWDFIFDAERICLIDEFYYIRRIHDASSTGAGDKRLVDTIRVNNLIIDKIKDTEFFNKYKLMLYDKKISAVSNRYLNIQDQYKEYFYDEIAKDFKMMLNHEDYEDFIYYISPRHKKFFDYAVYSADFEEFDILASDMFIQDNINDLFDGIDETNEKISIQRKKTRQITDSKSWKITKPLRKFKRIF